jgi:hypothetical protein
MITDHPDVLLIVAQIVAEIDRLIFQQDGAPAHFSALDERFHGRWIGKGGPPRSPDLTPMDYSFWGVHQINRGQRKGRVSFRFAPED